MPTQSFVVRLTRPDFSPAESLRDLVANGLLPGLEAVLDHYPNIVSHRVISSIAPQQLQRLEDSAGQSDFPPAHSLSQYWRIDASSLQDDAERERLLAELASVEEVEAAYPVLAAGEPTVNTPPNPHATQQHYLSAAPLGVDALYAWSQDCDGTGVSFIDYELNWSDHPDLPPINVLLGTNQNDVSEHGTKVLGVVAALDNATGMVGMAPAATVVGEVSPLVGGAYTYADAITKAAEHLGPGDLLLIELDLREKKGSSPRAFPLEVQPDVREAIRLAAAGGIVVIEAAGNGFIALEDAQQYLVDKYSAYNPSNVSDLTATQYHNMLYSGGPAFVDSGAVVVGAGGPLAMGWTIDPDGSPLPGVYGRWRHPDSNYGFRVDCHAHGQDVFTAFNGGYVSNFARTSAAAAIVAGAALLIQGCVVNGSLGVALKPKEMRWLLRSFGTPQLFPPPTAPMPEALERIGVMPDLRRILDDPTGEISSMLLETLKARSSASGVFLSDEPWHDPMFASRRLLKWLRRGFRL
jgi:hypothetical protein